MFSPFFIMSSIVLLIGLFIFTFSGKRATRWKVNFSGNTIVVENRISGERLYVNDELQDEQIGITGRSRLWGQLPTGEKIKVSIGGGLFKMHCIIFIDNKRVFSE